MTQIDQAWGAGPSEHYETLAVPFRPLFQRIREGAIHREVERKLPFEEIRWLKEAGFGAVRLPREAGGAGATLPDLFNLLIELAEADSNIPQALRGHFGLVEDVLNSRFPERRAAWLPRFARGELSGNAWSEVGDTKITHFTTRVVRTGKGAVLNGAKYYTTGSLFADWIHVGASNEEDKYVAVVVSRSAPGVHVVDDWDGFGQTLTASGTTTFTDVPVAEDGLILDEDRFAYSPAFYQLVHLATLTGIARAATNDVAKAVAERKRTYTHAAGARSAEDPQVLQIVGRVRGSAYAAGAITLKAAEAVQRAYEAHFAGDRAAEEQAIEIAELEAAQAQTVVSNLVLDTVTLLFDALGASAAHRNLGLDRHWRNARTLSSHNPRIYKDRIVGDFAVNGTKPPPQWRVGIPVSGAPQTETDVAAAGASAPANGSGLNGSAAARGAVSG